MKRRLLIVAIFLLAGAVVNVAVAFGCAAWSKSVGYPAKQALVDLPLAELGETRFARAFSGVGLQMDLLHSQAFDYHVDLSISAGWPLLSMRKPTWWHVSVPGPPPAPLTYIEIAELVKSLPHGRYSDSVLSSFLRSPELQESTEALLFVMSLRTGLENASAQAMSTPRRMLLTKPIWLGFVVNTLLYAVVLWLLICGPFVLRRRIRVKRGLCPKCAYPMGESGVCRECGGDAMKRRLLVAAAFLLVGAVVNVAVAWGCAVLLDVRTSVDKETAFVSKDRQTWYVWTLSRPGALSVFSVRSSSRSNQGFPVEEGRTVKDPSALIPSWTPFLTPTFALGEQSYEHRAAEGRGWPMLGLWCETSEGLGGGIRVGEWPPGGRGSRPIPKVLPLRPIWLGFAVNTLMYAVLLWLLIPGPFVLRRFIRVKRGRCVKCGYPMGESEVCTECGKPLPRRVKVAT